MKQRDRYAPPANRKQAELFKPYVDVTDKVIVASVRKNAHFCMFTRGLAYSLPGAVRISADVSVIRFTFGRYRYTYRTPAVVAEKVIAFDRGRTISPWSTRLQIPLGVVEVVNSKQLKDKPRRQYVRSGKYVAHSQKVKCGRWSSRRWHGLKIPEAA